MKFSDIFFSFLIILFFIGMYLSGVFVAASRQIKHNWPKHRCNPMVMPFAGMLGPDGTTASQNHSSCVQTQQKSAMGSLMAPIHYSSSLVNSIGSDVTSGLDMVRKVFAYVRNMVEQVVKKIIGIFMNIITEVLKLIIKLKDLGSKIMGVMAVLLFMLDGMVKTGTGIWAGPVGETIRFLCFHPSTRVQLKNFEVKRMSEIKVGDILENGSIVLGTMQLAGCKENPYYKIYSKQMYCDIFVTGSHMVQDKRTGKFIPVEELLEAERTKEYTSEMCCLITDDHLIPVGEYMFWDWEDGN